MPVNALSESMLCTCVSLRLILRTYLSLLRCGAAAASADASARCGAVNNKQSASLDPNSIPHRAEENPRSASACRSLLSCQPLTNVGSVSKLTSQSPNPTPMIHGRARRQVDACQPASI